MFGLSFLFPVFLLGALAVAVPVVLHLMRRESAPEVRFSAVHLLRRAAVEQRRPRRLQEWLLLALRAAAVLLLALAFARPYLAGSAASASAVTVVAVDRSYSMGAPGQFEQARTLARAALREAPAGHLVALVAFDVSADVLVEPTADRDAAVAALERVAPGFGGTRYPSGLAAAAGATGGRDGRLVVVTDLQRSGWEAGDEGRVPERLDVEVVEVDAPPVNLAVTALHREAGALVAVVSNDSGDLAPVEPRLSIDGRVVASHRATVPPRSTIGVRFEVPLPQVGLATVEIDDPDGYPADNARHLVLDPPPPVNLLAVTATGNLPADALYLERALGVGDDEVETVRFNLRAAEADRIVDALAAPGSGPAGILLLSTRGLDRRGREALGAWVREGGGLLVAGGDDTDPELVAGLIDGRSPTIEPGEAGETGPDLRLAPVDARHPIFRPFGELAGNVGQVRFRRVMTLDEPAESLVIARFTSGAPALIEQRVDRGRVLLFASDLNNRWNDFPLHPTFVPFVHETLRYLTGGRADAREWLIGEQPAGAAPQPGLATVGQPPRHVAVNVDPRESDASRISPAEFQGAISRLHVAAAVEERADAREREERQGLWRYGLLLVLAVLTAEGMLGARLAR